ncbi:MAG: 3'-5' exonuclease, partial [Clostridiales bacterium]|nr:3'-5' exonuclease [Clostridiales bacterium]
NLGDVIRNTQNRSHKVGGTLSGEAEAGHKKAEPSDFLILFRYKKHMPIYARALEKRGIPFEITGSASFAESEEIGEITNLALALNDPDNPIFTVAVLRGIFFGVSDNDLIEFKREGGRFHFMMPGKDILECKKLGATVVSMALAKMREWRKWTLELPPSAALQKIFEDSGILNFYVSLEMGSSRVGNVLKLLEIVRHEEQKGVTAFAQMVRFLEELSEVREVEEMSLTPARENAVRLMNLHKAKGLEGRVVFLADPVGIKEHEVEKHIIRVGSELGSARQARRGGHGAGDGGAGPCGYFVFREAKARGKADFRPRKILSQPVGWEEAAQEEQKYEEAEETRLNYVAATRARDMLVISTYADELKNKAWEILDSALDRVPKLEVEASGEGEEKREKVMISRAEAERARKEMRESWSAAALPTYAVESVTRLARRKAEPAKEATAEGAEPREKERKRLPGYGLSWGRIVHQVLEAVGSGRLKPEKEKLELFLGNIMTAEESDFSEKAELLAYVDSILSSPFWARVMRAERRFFEVPFAIKTDRKNLEAVKRPTPGRGKDEGRSARGDGIPVIVSGAIDLVFWEEGRQGKGGKGADGGDGSGEAGWVIADYKTDRIPISEATLRAAGPEFNVERVRALSPEFASIIDFHAPQIRLYARFWSQITGEPVKEAGLYFTSIGRWVAT